MQLKAPATQGHAEHSACGGFSFLILAVQLHPAKLKAMPSTGGFPSLQSGPYTLLHRLAQNHVRSVTRKPAKVAEGWDTSAQEWYKPLLFVI